jgi:two-component system, OmpR family, sensor kinase
MVIAFRRVRSMRGPDERFNETPTRRETADEDLQARVVALEEAMRARDAFISVIAHELRNPMTPIRAQVDLLLRLVRGGRASTERLEVGLERVAWQIERYVARATTLLDIKRATAGKLRFEPESVHLATLLREVTVSLAPIAAHAGSEITIDASDAVTGTWDRLAVEQIVENLLTNAIKYGAGKPIEVKAQAQDERVLLTVRDRGIGISEADRARIFERFERVVGQHDGAGGFGVGLWLVRQLVDAMGGTRKVQGNLGEGTTFAVSLPLYARGA